MKIIKDNSQKEYKVTCQYCRSKFSFNSTEFVRYMGGLKFVDCPVCKMKNAITKTFGFYQTY
jgi:uncharacterized Zn-finger protein